MSYKVFFIAVLCLFWGLSAQAQSSLQITNAQLILQSDNLSGLQNFTELELEEMDGAVLDSIFATRPFAVTASIYVSDTSNVQTIHIRIGRTQGGTDLANVSIPYNGTLPSNVLGIHSDSEEIQIEFGQHYNVNPLYLEVWIDDKMGQTTPVLQASNL